MLWQEGCKVAKKESVRMKDKHGVYSTSYMALTRQLKTRISKTQS